MAPSQGKGSGFNPAAGSQERVRCKDSLRLGPREDGQLTRWTEHSAPNTAPRTRHRREHTPASSEVNGPLEKTRKVGKQKHKPCAA